MQRASLILKPFAVINAGERLMGQRPLDILNESLNGPVIVKLKDGRVFRGELQGYDIHMNLVLDKTEEVAEGAVARKIGTVIVRGDNVVYISP